MRIPVTLLLALVAFGGHSFAQTVKALDLKLFSTITLANCHIYEVRDKRRDTTALGTIKDEIGKPIKLTTTKGLAAAYGTYLNFAVKQNGGATPIAVYINQLQVTQNEQNTAIETAFAFYKDGEMLTEYTGRASAGSGITPIVNAEQLVRESLDRALAQFDAWWAKNSQTARIDGSAKFRIVLEETPKQAGYLGMDYARKLKWTDFKGTPPTNVVEKASTSSGINLRYEADVDGSRTTVKVIITPFFNTKTSWVKAGATDLVLLHEQQHFLITLLEACYLESKLKKAKLHADDYEKKVQALYNEAITNIRNRQAKYDSETRHSMDMMKQRFWNDHIINEVREYGCFGLDIHHTLRP